MVFKIISSSEFMKTLMNNSNSEYSKSVEQYLEQEQFNRDQFFKFYELQNRIVHPDPDVPGGGEQYIIDKNLWECRFCGRSKADGASYKKRAHILPEQLGNKLIISHSECDDCNMFFANHESHLGNFLGPLKTLLEWKENLNRAQEYLNTKYQKQVQQLLLQENVFFGSKRLKIL